MELFLQAYQTGDVVKATGVLNSTLQTWIRRDRIVGHRESGEEVGGAGSPGRYRQFSFRNIMEIALAKSLLDCGMRDMDAVFRIGMTYAHTGSDQRVPGMPYHWSRGRTIIGYCAETNMVDDEIWQPGTDVYLNLGAKTRAKTGLILLDFSEVYQLVCHRLGYDPAEQINEAYGYQPEAR